MSNKHDTGGPAFPSGVALAGGMTLLDWFAGQAPGMPNWFERQMAGMGPSTVEIAVRWRWVWAESMLAEKRRRESGQGGGE